MKGVQILSHMNTGAGETSYAKNCSVQKSIISLTKPVIEEAIEEIIMFHRVWVLWTWVALPHPTPYLSSQTFSASYTTIGPSEFRVYLNDLYTNDFNTLKRQLGTGCYVSGVPGSFYHGILPAKTVHFVHSSSSNHWLSQVPAGLNGKERINKGKIYISRSSPQCVVDAYSAQFRADFSAFLRCRSEEVVAGGVMVLSLMGRIDMDLTTMDSCYQWELLALALMSMVSEKLVEEEMVDSLNAPYYAPCAEEIRQEVDEEGSFYIRHLEALEVDWDGDGTFDPVSSGLRVAKTIRAVVESMLVVAHGFGQHIMDDLFRRYGDLVALHLSNNTTKYTNLVISLTKKV